LLGKVTMEAVAAEEAQAEAHTQALPAVERSTVAAAGNPAGTCGPTDRDAIRAGMMRNHSMSALRQAKQLGSQCECT
jgi:hypothetical protein